MSTPSSMETMETRPTSTIIDMSMSSIGSTNIANLPLSDPWCNSVKCLAFKAAEDASQAEVPFASQFLYGHWIVYYYCVFILGFSLLYVYRRLGAAYVDYPEPKTTALQKITAVWRAFSYRKLKIGMSLGHTLLIGLGIVFMTILTFVQRPYFRPRISYGSPPLGVRTGMMALALTPIIVALTGKYNFVTLITGISYERLNILHRYIGYICFGLGLIHSIAFIVAILRDSNYSPLFEKIGATEVSPSIPNINDLYSRDSSIPVLYFSSCFSFSVSSAPPGFESAFTRHLPFLTSAPTSSTSASCSGTATIE